MKKAVYILNANAASAWCLRRFRENEKAEDEIISAGCVPLNPVTLPGALGVKQYLRIALAMMDSADAVFLVASKDDEIGLLVGDGDPVAEVEYNYALALGLPMVTGCDELEEVLTDAGA